MVPSKATRSGKAPSRGTPARIDLDIHNELENECPVIHSPTKSPGILDLVLSKETREALKEVTVLYHAFVDHGWRLTKLEFLKAYMLLEKYYFQKPK